MNKNNRYLIKLWIPAVVLIVYLAFSIIRDSTNLIIVPFVIAFLIILRSRIRNTLGKALQNSGPEPLIRSLTPKPSKFLKPELGVTTNAYNRAFAYLLYGEFEHARAAMKEVDWQSMDPMFQAMDYSMKSLICYFTGDVTNGLTYAHKTKELGSVSTMFPGSKRSSEITDAYIEVGQVLSGYCTTERMNSLELKFQKAAALTKLILGWGLMNGYKQRGDTAGYNRMQQYFRVHAPHCSVLINPLPEEPLSEAE
ncbi:hypothetical protein [Paenibacillus sp. sgz500958]|uniref:hypothetical protein n=1 Tax=Paenibacillus sp. sgz500958 TaxID=3242475 RepID=UPI0036D26B79